MSKQSEYVILHQEKYNKISRINDLMDEMDMLASEHVLSPEYDPNIGEWSPEKETGFIDACRIEEEIHTLEFKVKKINRKLGSVKRRDRRNSQAHGGSAAKK